MTSLCVFVMCRGLDSAAGETVPKARNIPQGRGVPLARDMRRTLVLRSVHGH